MAIADEGSVIAGLRGALGEVVVRRVRGKTVVSRRPRKRSRPPSGAQAQSCSRFARAVAFAREAASRPTYRSLARMGRGYSPYHVALADFMSVPAFHWARVDPWPEAQGFLLRLAVAEAVAVQWVRLRLPGAPPLPGSRLDGWLYAAREGIGGAEQGASGITGQPDLQRLPPAARYFARPGAAPGPSAEPGGRRGREERVELWVARLPGLGPAAGEVLRSLEVAAVDYAGNYVSVSLAEVPPAGG